MDRDAAFELLFTEEYQKVVAIANRVLRDRSEAEDVAQEVFMSFNRLHDPSATYAGPWLYSASAHRALNRIRDLRRRRQREMQDALTTPPAIADPEAVVQAGERREVVRAAMANLRGKYATVLALRYSGLSYAEVASSLKVNIGQVGTLLRRAEAELKKEVQRVSPE